MKKITQGMSGCFIEVTSRKSIIKRSPNKNYNQRLLVQSKKQHLFSQIYFRNIYVPKVIGQGEVDDCFYFEMEYASGLGALDFINQADKKELLFFCETIFSYLDQIRENSEEFDAKKTLSKKIKEMISKSKNHEFLNFILNFVDSHCNLSVCKTMCHGDLTFSNIIFDKNRIFLVDFLDSYLDTFFCDLAKLKQDLFYLWSALLYGNSDLRYIQAMKFMWERLDDRFKKEMDTPQFKIIDALNILRIEPYITNKKQAEIFNLALRKNPLYEDFNDSNGGKIL